jgi:hypothetical protein
LKAKLIKVAEFQVVSFFDPKSKPEPSQIIVLYALGSDGVLRELGAGGKWRSFPVYETYPISEDGSL